MQSINLFMQAICSEVQGLHRQWITPEQSSRFDETCPKCGEPAGKVRHKGEAVFVHSVVVEGGQVVRADYHRAPAPLQVIG